MPLRAIDRIAVLTELLGTWRDRATIAERALSELEVAQSLDVVRLTLSRVRRELAAAGPVEPGRMCERIDVQAEAVAS